MTLIGPILDDRTYEQLRDELVKRIPVYAPEWTDHNPSDPGVALLELFAYLGESVLYRFNQIPDATKVAFLGLLGVQPRPAQVAGTLLVARTERPDGVQVLRHTEARAGSVAFETAEEVYAWPLEVLALGKKATTDATVESATSPAAAAAARTEQRRRLDAIAALNPDEQKRAAKNAVFYVTQTVPPDPTDADAEILDVSTTADQTLWVALLARTEALQPVVSSNLLNRTVFVGVAMDERVLPDPFDLVPVSAPSDGTTDRPSDRTVLPDIDLIADPPPVIWELWNGPVGQRPDLKHDPDFATLAVPNDTTRGLTTTGVVTITVPGRLPRVAGLRPEGNRQSPPPLDDPAVARRVVAWLRARRPPAASPNSVPDAIHGVRWVGVNAVPVVQARSTATSELLGTGTGDPGQTYALTQRPVMKGTVQLEVEEADGWVSWTEAESSTRSGPLDRHFTVDLAAGLVRFAGRGQVPQIGQRIRVVTYRYGGGSEGNVPAGAITGLTGVAGVQVKNVLAAVGGADAASLTDALEEIPAEVHRRDRAVTPEDFRALALQVPGVCRADVLPLMHPDHPREEAAGVLSVMIFPTEDLRHPTAPMPDGGLLRRVAAYLNPRRLITSELYVIPPTYREIAVSVGVVVRAGYQIDAVRRWVERILQQYLSPVPPYGPDGGGWPAGRTVRRAELEAVAVQVDGVEYVEGLQLAVRDDDGTGKTTSDDGSTGPAWEVGLNEVTFDKWQVPSLGMITVAQGQPIEVGTAFPPPPVTGGTGAVLVPLPPDVCR